MSNIKHQINEATYKDLYNDLNKQAKRHINKSFLLFCLGGGVLVFAGIYYCIADNDAQISIYLQLVPAVLSIIASMAFISFGIYFARLYNQTLKQKVIVIITDISAGKITPNEALDWICKYPDRPLIYIGDDSINSAAAIGKKLTSKK